MELLNNKIFDIIAILCFCRNTFAAIAPIKSIYEQLYTLANLHSEFATIENIGNTSNFNELLVIKLSDKNIKNRLSIWIDCGIHGNEWITPVVCLHIVEELLENRESFTYLWSYDWHILTLFNPDGYVYSTNTKSNWSKNGKGVIGVDLNENFPGNWQSSDLLANQSDPDPMFYKEAKAVNLDEVKHVIKYLSNVNDKFIAYITLHDKEQTIRYPWKSHDSLLEDFKDLNQTGHKMKIAMESIRDAKFTVGQAFDHAHGKYGKSIDWARRYCHVKYVYALHLSSCSGEPIPHESPKKSPTSQTQEKYICEHVSNIKHISDEAMAAINALVMDILHIDLLDNNVGRCMTPRLGLGITFWKLMAVLFLILGSFAMCFKIRCGKRVSSPKHHKTPKNFHMSENNALLQNNEFFGSIISNVSGCIGANKESDQANEKSSNSKCTD